MERVARCLCGGLKAIVTGDRTGSMSVIARYANCEPGPLCIPVHTTEGRRSGRKASTKYIAVLAIAGEPFISISARIAAQLSGGRADHPRITAALRSAALPIRRFRHQHIRYMRNLCTAGSACPPASGIILSKVVRQTIFRPRLVDLAQHFDTGPVLRQCRCAAMAISAMPPKAGM